MKDNYSSGYTLLGDGKSRPDKFGPKFRLCHQVK
jgi:hypothetical protein